jgi:hypothetical protein
MTPRSALRSIVLLAAAAVPLAASAGTFEILASSPIEPGSKIPAAI